MGIPDTENQAAEGTPALVLIFAVMTILWSLLTFLGSILPALHLIDPSDGFLIEVPAWIDYSVLGMSALKFVAAILLIKMWKVGFYLYAVAELCVAILNVIYGISLYEWAEGSASASGGIDPTLVVIIFMAVQMALSIVWVGGHSAHLHKMR